MSCFCEQLTSKKKNVKFAGRMDWSQIAGAYGCGDSKFRNESTIVFNFDMRIDFLIQLPQSLLTQLQQKIKLTIRFEWIQWPKLFRNYVKILHKLWQKEYHETHNTWFWLKFNLSWSITQEIQFQLFSVLLSVLKILFQQNCLMIHQAWILLSICLIFFTRKYNFPVNTENNIEISWKITSLKKNFLEK